MLQREIPGGTGCPAPPALGWRTKGCFGNKGSDRQHRLSHICHSTHSPMKLEGGESQVWNTGIAWSCSSYSQQFWKMMLSFLDCAQPHPQLLTLLSQIFYSFSLTSFRATSMGDGTASLSPSVSPYLQSRARTTQLPCKGCLMCHSSPSFSLQPALSEGLMLQTEWSELSCPGRPHDSPQAIG